MSVFRGSNKSISLKTGISVRCARDKEKVEQKKLNQWLENEIGSKERGEWVTTLDGVGTEKESFFLDDDDDQYFWISQDKLVLGYIMLIHLWYGMVLLHNVD